MKTRLDIDYLSTEQLKQLVGNLYVELDEREELIEEVLEQQKEQTLAFARKEVALKRELKAMCEEKNAWQEKYCKLEKRAIAAEVRSEAMQNTPPMTIIYGNYATPMYIGSIHEQKNNSNHNTKKNMNNPTINNYGGNNQIGDGSTMNVFEADKRENLTFSPTQDQMIHALTRLAAGELSVGKIADTCWWGVHKFLSEYKLTDLNMAEFSVYLVNHHIQEKNIYNNFRQTGRNLTMLSRLKVADWGDVDGATTEAAQRQIDVVKCLQKELCEEEPL